MQIIFQFVLGLLLLANIAQVQALSMGPDEFAAARQLTCVLAQDSLGYLSEDDFVVLADDVLADYDTSGGDVIYAKALGYFDGLMFGLPAGDQKRINARLHSFLESHACTSIVNFSY
ncbi:MAG: hypothetical protein ACK5ME_12175 [Parahaliea sp.]